MRTYMLRRKVAFTVLIPLTLLMGSCGNRMDLKAVRNLAELSSEAKEVFPKIANDVYSSCLRTARYIPLRAVPSGETVVALRNKAEAECELEPRQASKSLIPAHLVLVEYLEALGELAADDLTSYDTELNSIGESLEKIPQFPKEQINAGTAIARFLFRISTERFRRNQIREVVVNTDEDLQVYVQGLILAVSAGYTDGALENEKSTVEDYYRTYIGDLINAQKKENTAEITTALTGLDSQWQAAKETIREKKQFSQTYLALLRAIARDHAELKKMYVSGKTPSTKQLNEMVKSYVKTLEPMVEKSDKLFNKNIER